MCASKIIKHKKPNVPPKKGKHKDTEDVGLGGLLVLNAPQLAGMNHEICSPLEAGVVGGS